ncbi:MAG: hypothetical protein HKO59_00475 [Phycisphaerales bacterium]|nr:hypothetical protein [Phycisphaerae bacterium]NNF44183.1 hypothetical protein [Phycisphaerales bacterium]NNM24455.1 hypothetical protein [Phycisphaerales bacterium]
MQLSRRQKSFGTIAGLCVVALLVDRLFLAPSGATAAGDSTPDTATTTPPSPLPAVTAPPARNSKHVIAEKLDRLAETEQLDPDNVRDAFLIPEGWIPETPEFITPVEQGSAAAEFLAAHRLNAVMANSRGGYAIIDGKRLRAGEQLDGFTLVDVRARSAILERDGIRIELSLP